LYNRNPTRPLHHALTALQALTIQAPSAEAAENYANEIRLALETQANANPPVR
jgi:hypothetical protein